jgi:hypothetical protein
MLLNERLESPYNQILKNEVPLLSKVIVKSSLSDKIKDFSVPDVAERLSEGRTKSASLKENKKLLKQSNIIFILIIDKKKYRKKFRDL